MIDLKNLTIEAAHEGFKTGKFTCRGLAEEYLKVISEKNKELNAFIEVFDDCLEAADLADKKFTDGSATFLTGIPIAIKDNILFEGHIASSGSDILRNYIASYNSTAVKKLKDAGAVIIGRTNMDDGAMGVSTETSAFFISLSKTRAVTSPLLFLTMRVSIFFTTRSWNIWL